MKAGRPRVVLSITIMCLFMMGSASGQERYVKGKISQMTGQLLGGAPQGQTPTPVAVMAFSSSEGKAKVRELGKAVGIMVHEQLANDARFQLIEREKLGKIAAEIALGQTGLVDESTAKKAGEMVGAHLIITGSVAELGAFFLVTSRVIDVGTGEVKKVSGAEIRQKNLIAVSSKYVMVKKYSIVPAFQSALIPGWGQFYNDQPKKGTFFLLTGMASGASAGLTYLFYQNIRYDDQESHQTSKKAYKQWQKAYQIFWGSVGVYAGFAFINVVDAFWVSHRNLKSYKEESGAGKRVKPDVYLARDRVGADLVIHF